jgi:hypothetical protein
MVRDEEKLSSGLDSAPQKSVNLAKHFKKVFDNCKKAGLSNIRSMEHVFQHSVVCTICRSHSNNFALHYYLKKTKTIPITGIKKWKPFYRKFMSLVSSIKAPDIGAPASRRPAQDAADLLRHFTVL